MAVIEPDGVGALQPDHASDQVRFRRLQDDRVMIGHQAVGVHPSPCLLAGLRQRLNEILAIHIVHLSSLSDRHGS